MRKIFHSVTDNENVTPIELSRKIIALENKLSLKQGTESKLKKRIEYEKMLAEISSEAVLSKDQNIFLDTCVKKIGMVLDVSRVYIFGHDQDTNKYTVMSEWAAKGLPTSADLNLSTFSIPGVTNRLAKREIIRVEDVEIALIGEEEKEIARVQNIKSIIIMPLFLKDKFFGFIGFDECRFCREWLQQDVYILSTASQIIIQAIEGSRNTEKLAKHQRLLDAIFSSVKDAIITVDTNMCVLEANKATLSICGINPDSIKGKSFYDYATTCNKACNPALKETIKNKSQINEHRIECKEMMTHKQIVTISSTPLIDPKGIFLGAVLLIRDISQLCKMERELNEGHQFTNIIGKSKNTRETFEFINNLADLDTTVLITGESGTGKEIVARAIHNSGVRSFKPFIAVNCSALSENLLESELFGHVKGAFTGASKDKEGRFQAANQGTILLDEIGDISPRIQLKLLRFLQDKEFERVGESKTRKIDVRVIACTNCNLKEKIKKGEFREDLYYRFNIMEIHLSPLRERVEDIPLLVDYYCNYFNDHLNKNIKGVHQDVLEAFIHYPWPGNIRELMHTIERAWILCKDDIVTIHEIHQEIGYYKSLREKKLKKNIENGPNTVLQHLEMTDWNIAKASRLLGISRQTLYKKIKKYKMTKPSRQEEAGETG
jgi:PAS domain S-box-containing protein